MINNRHQVEKCYTELARSIGALQLKSQLNVAEASCLLDVLDLVIVQEDSEFNRVLSEFLEFEGVQETHEIEEIVKATLIGSNLKLQEELDQVKIIIDNLTQERNRILIAQQEE